jgi:hypothetical protein
VDSLQSHMILTMSHWSSGLPVCFPPQGSQVQIPWGVLVWNQDSPVSDVSLHWWPRLDWSSTELCPQLSLGPRADNVTVSLDLTQLSCPGFTLAVGLPSGFTTDSRLLGGSPVESPAISHDSYHVSLVRWTTCLLPATRVTGSNPLGATCVKPGFSC